MKTTFFNRRGHCLAPAVPQFWLHCGGWRLHCGAGGFTAGAAAPAVNMLEEALLWSHLAGADPGGEGGGALGLAPTPGTEGPAQKSRIPLSQGRKEGTPVSLEWLFNTIQA